MILCCCFGNKRSAMCDLYKNLLNSMPHKNDIIAIIPSAYSKNEFSDQLAARYVEDITSIKNKRKRFLYLFRYFFYLKNLLKKYDIEYIYFQNDTFMYNIIICLLYRLNVKYTLWLHDPILHDGTTRLESIYRTCSIYTYFHMVKKFILSYHAALDEVSFSSKLKQYRDKMVTLFLPQMPEMEFDDIKQQKEEPVYDYIFYGRIEEYKGLEVLVEAFKSIESEKKLLIVGSGRDEKNIKRIIQSNNNILFINQYVANRDLAQYIMQSKCVVLPYKSATGSQTIAIANYYDRIVIATKVGCFPEYIQEGKNGFFIDDYSVEAMKRALNQTDYYINKCTPEKIKSVYDKFDINKISYQLYNEIVS